MDDNDPTKWALRKKETQEAYDLYKVTHVNEESFYDWRENLIRDFQYWRIIENRFPADKVTQTHHLLLPVRKFPDYSDMNSEEEKELFEIKKIIVDDYDCIMENFCVARSVEDHFHFHLIKWVKQNL